uniref:V2-like protein n=1 Tax=Citrus chlorotic dwarf associated virus TaxID=1202142 RepID=A0A8G0YKR0_9GEMI|nr:V2-like protein [Citrus chlorotic dwarf associated virus]
MCHYALSVQDLPESLFGLMSMLSVRYLKCVEEREMERSLMVGNPVGGALGNARVLIRLIRRYCRCRDWVRKGRVNGEYQEWRTIWDKPCNDCGDAANVGHKEKKEAQVAEKGKEAQDCWGCICEGPAQEKVEQRCSSGV